MNRILPWLLAGLIGAAVGGAVVWFTRPADPPAPLATPSPATAPAQAPAAPATGTPPAAQMPTAPAAPPPWLTGEPGSTAPAPAPGGAPQPGAPADPQAMAALQEKFSRLIEGGRQPAPAEVEALLGELERAQGSSVVGGVRIDVLRSNLVKSQQMQALAEEIQRLAEQPGGPDQQAIQRKLAELQKLQSELRLDLMAPQAR